MLVLLYCFIYYIYIYTKVLCLHIYYYVYTCTTTMLPGWGGGGSTVVNSRLAKDPKYQEFLSTLQAAMLKEYTAGAMRKNFGR